jgi:hypothetical protein
VAKCICREAHRLDPPGMPRPYDRVRRSASAPSAPMLPTTMKQGRIDP